jgi:hypothetical protein
MIELILMGQHRSINNISRHSPMHSLHAELNGIYIRITLEAIIEKDDK